MTLPLATPARRVLLLQGPAGPFFAELQAALDAAGHHAVRAVFDSGDRLFAGAGPTIRFTGTPEELPSWLGTTLRTHAIDTLMLFGDERPIHKMARAEARALGLDVLCFEEGYLRPGYITAEWQGNNHNSPLVGRLAGTLDATPAGNPARNGSVAGTASDPLPPAPVPPGPGPMIRAAILQYGTRILFSRKSERAMFHRLRSPFAEILARGPMNLLVRLARTHPDRRLRQRMQGELAGRYDLVALQVPDDPSLTVGGEGWTSRDLIETVIASFASAAPADRHLVFRIHPVARGHIADAIQIHRSARLHGVGERVHCVHTGPLAACLRGARGFITITSTSAFSALLHGKVVVVLGRSIAGSNGVTFREGIGPRQFPHDFWTAEERAPAASVTRLLNLIRAEALLPGDFYHPLGRQIAVRHCLDKLARSASGACRATPAGTRTSASMAPRGKAA